MYSAAPYAKTAFGSTGAFFRATAAITTFLLYADSSTKDVDDNNWSITELTTINVGLDGAF